MAKSSDGRGDLPDADAEPLFVLIHGLAQDKHIWDRVIPDLPGRSRAYDLRGHGGSPLGMADGTLQQLADDLIELLSQIGPATCIGFSLGGAIALLAAAQRPDLVEGVVAIATSSVVGRAAAAALTERITVFESGDRARITDVVLADTISQLGRTQSDAAAIAQLRMIAMSDPLGYVNGARAVLSMRETSLNDRLGDIASPVLIISGELDVWCPRRAAEIMLEQMPAQFVEVSGVGHLIPDEAPADLASAIRNWLELRGK